jgi:hypothetical protein
VRFKEKPRRLASFKVEAATMPPQFGGESRNESGVRFKEKPRRLASFKVEAAPISGRGSAAKAQRVRSAVQGEAATTRQFQSRNRTHFRARFKEKPRRLASFK